MSKVLVFAHVRGGALPASVLHAVSAAGKVGGSVDLALLGAGITAASVEGVAKIFVAESAALAEGIAETLTPTLLKLVQTGGYTHVFTASDSTGKTVLPRLAALADCQAISDITAVVSPTQFVRPIYAGNAIATVEVQEKIVFATIRATGFEKAALGGNAAIETLAVEAPQGVVPTLVGREETKSERPELASARIVVSGGRGVGSAENFKIIEALADKLGGAVGASRAAVDSGYIGNDHQVGQTGKIVAPELYIAVGLSGAIQHMAGMKDSKVIVAINKDPEAPIMQVADYALEADLFQALPELTSKL